MNARNCELKLAEGKLELPKKLTLRPHNIAAAPRNIAAALTLLEAIHTMLLRFKSCSPSNSFPFEWVFVSSADSVVTPMSNAKF